ncbi:MAG TPA: bifunctional riboflavin kinase/FAD synthetase [Thermoanaerobaculia bacterium]|nr:bifunctional riboflavin kinase/FAD synthetase [Thermoanaerobaculia bacterium]
MLVVHDAYESSDLPRGCVVAIGNFDGVHRGQRAILDVVVARARELRAAAVVVTFDPHPLSVLRPEQAPLPITTPAQKERLLAEAGIAVALVVRFTREFARTPAGQFVREFLGAKLAAREVYVGESFCFGHRREGTLELLRGAGEELGFAANGVPEVMLHGERVSSTRIRRAIAQGQVEEAAEMLGHPFSITGTVVRGDRMGQRLGWPTINVAAEHKLLPADGVYASRVLLPSFPASFDCATNIGTRPTVYENYQRVVESHILDFKADVYGQRVELSFYKRLREERIFPTVMDLSAQIGRDVEATREYFSRRRLEQEVPPARL